MILRARSPLSIASLLTLALAGGCKKDDDGCTLGDDTTCDGGLVCEQVQGGEPACFMPVYVRGDVFDGLEEAAIPGADVVALDANGQAMTFTTETDVDGSYELRVPALRDADGNVVDAAVTLRVDADAYVPFPSPPRFAIPIDLTTAVEMGGLLVIDSVVTDVALFSIDAGSYGTIIGTISAEAAGGLVVAEQGGVAVSTAIVDADGSFTLFNVPLGASTVTAYVSGFGSDSATVTIANDGDAETVTLTASTAGLATVEGSLNAVNAPDWSGEWTSVLLVVESTFSEITRAGYSPAGLRDGSLTGSDLSFTIEGVPPGRYVVLASFENDGLVRDPDLTQGGTSIRHIEVSDAGVVTSLEDPLSGDTEDLNGIKVTDAIAVVGPGAEGLEAVTAAPTFSWAKDSGLGSTGGYYFRIYDAYGELVYEHGHGAVDPLDLIYQPPSGDDPVTYDLDDAFWLTPVPGFVDGMIYQFRVFSTDGVDLLSSTEDLRGVFQFQP